MTQVWLGPLGEDVDQKDYLGIFHMWIVVSEKGTFQTAAPGWDELK